MMKGKGQKDRYLMLSPKLLAVLRAWWKAQRPRHWLFPGERTEAPTTRSAAQLACQPPQGARLGKAVTPHLLRHNSGIRIIPSQLRGNGGSACSFNVLRGTTVFDVPE